MKKSKINSLIFSSFLVLFVFFSFESVVVYASSYGADIAASEAELSTTGSIEGTAGDVIAAGLTMVGVLFLALMIYGGIIWMTARGNEEATRKAKNTIIASVVGLLIVISSYAITTFVFKAVG